MNGLHEPCRWCNKSALLNGSGRCDDCDNHYRSHAVRIVSHLEKRNFHYGNYIAFGIILLISFSFAACVFDQSLGSVRCTDQTPRTSANITQTTKCDGWYAVVNGSRIWSPVMCKNMTPDKWAAMGIINLKAYLNGTLNLNITKAEAKTILDGLNMMVGKQAELLRPITSKSASTAIPPALVPTNSTTVGGKISKNTTVKPCTTQKENDWMAYCQSNLVGFDCFNANKDTKEMIMRNMAEIHGCRYAN